MKDATVITFKVKDHFLGKVTNVNYTYHYVVLSNM